MIRYAKNSIISGILPFLACRVILLMLIMFPTLFIFAGPAHALQTTVTSGDYTYTVINESQKTARLNRIDNAYGEVLIPDMIDGYRITKIGNYITSNIFSSTFYGPNHYVTSITIPDSVTTIGEGAFSDCYSLTSITIPDSVTTIGEGAFYGCSSLTGINVSADNKNYKSIDGILFNKTETQLIQYPARRDSQIYHIPATVNSIGDWTFYYCSSLTSITIPNGVTTIGDCAFYYCSSLTSITIPNGVTTIGDCAFYRCSSLTSITIPNSVTSIGSGPFSGCTKLTGINVGADNKNYKSIDGILFNKTEIQLIQYPAGRDSQTYHIPASVTTIGDWAFCRCSSLTNIIIPNGVTTIGDWAFYYCSSLTSIIIPNGVTTIGERAFYGCSSLAWAKFEGHAPRYFGFYVFDGCAPDFKIYYYKGATGFTNPWHGYPTEAIDPDEEKEWKNWPEQKSINRDKTWTIKFSSPLDNTTVNHDNIYVLAANNEKVATKLETAGDKLSVMVKPTDNYLGGETYYLYIKDLKSASGLLLKERVKMKFTIE